MANTDPMPENETQPAILYVNAYSVCRNYGGPEEGGWWYDSGEPLASIPIRSDDPDFDSKVEMTKKELRETLGWPIGPTRQGRYSVIGDSDFEVWVEEHVAREFPEQTPHYE